MSSRTARKAAFARMTWGFTELLIGGIPVPVEGTVSIRSVGPALVWLPSTYANKKKRERRARRRA